MNDFENQKYDQILNAFIILSLIRIVSSFDERMKYSQNIYEKTCTNVCKKAIIFWYFERFSGFPSSKLKDLCIDFDSKLSIVETN